MSRTSALKFIIKDGVYAYISAPTPTVCTLADTYYFAYGMLTDPNIMQDAQFMGKATLKNFAFEFAVYANLIPESMSTVEGVLWAITRKKLAELDRVEGDVNGNNVSFIVYDFEDRPYRKIEGVIKENIIQGTKSYLNEDGSIELTAKRTLDLLSRDITRRPNF